MERDNVGDWIKLYALRDIAEGEELTMLYSEHNHRSDVSLLVYGHGLALAATPAMSACPAL